MPVVQHGLVIHSWPHDMQQAVDALGSDQAMALFSVPTPDTASRLLTRQRIRVALRETLSVFPNHRAASITLVSHPGRAIWLDGPHSQMQLSVSHLPGISVAAVSRCGAIGADVMQIVPSAGEMSDWTGVALDYLGPAVTCSLQRVPAVQRPADFAQAWTRLEAGHKCLGLGLAEWKPTLAQQLAKCHVKTLTLRENCRGAVGIKL